MDTMTYSSRQAVDQSLLDAYKSMQHNNQFVDGCLSADGCSIEVHLVLMASRSSYLRHLFTDNAPETEFKFDGITARGLTAVVDFVYTGRVMLAATNFMEVLEAALCLEMLELMGFCLDFSRHRPSLWAFTLNLEEKYGEIAKPLRDSVIASATCQQLCDLMASENVRFNSEQAVFKLALDWLTQHRPLWLQKGEKKLAEVTVHVLSMVRYGLLSDMSAVAQQAEELEGNERALAIGYKYHQCRQQQPLVRSHINCVRNNFPKLVVLGGVDGGGATSNASMCASLDPELGQFENFGILPSPCVQSGAVAVNGFVFIVGGQKCSDGRGNSACKTMYRLDTRHKKWVQGADMANERSFFPLVRMGDVWLLAVGGVQNGHTLQEVEAYSITKNTWRSFTPLPHALSGHAGAVISGQLYVCGGISSETKVVDTMYRLEKALWCQLGRMHTARTGHTVVQHDTGLLVCGGSTREEHGGWRHVSTMEKYNALNGQWTELASPPIPMSYATACVYGNKMYIIGGYNDLITLQSVSVYDIHSDSWTERRHRLPKCLAKAMCVALEPQTPLVSPHPTQCRICCYLQRDDDSTGNEVQPIPLNAGGPRLDLPYRGDSIRAAGEAEFNGWTIECYDDPTPLTDVLSQTSLTLPKSPTLNASLKEPGSPRLPNSGDLGNWHVDFDDDSQTNPLTDVQPQISNTLLYTTVSDTELKQTLHKGHPSIHDERDFDNRESRTLASTGCIGGQNPSTSRPTTSKFSFSLSRIFKRHQPRRPSSSSGSIVPSTVISGVTVAHSVPSRPSSVLSHSMHQSRSSLSLHESQVISSRPSTVSLPSLPQSVCDETGCFCTGLEIQFDLPPAPASPEDLNQLSVGNGNINPKTHAKQGDETDPKKLAGGDYELDEY